MNVSAVGRTGTSAVTSQIEALRKQVTRLTKDLRELATSADDAKTKELRQQLITQQIAMLEARIAALQNQQSQQQSSSTTAQPLSAPVTAQAAAGPSSSTRAADGTGWKIDVQL